MPVCGRERDIISSSSCCLAKTPEAFRVYTSFGIERGKVSNATLSLGLSIDCTMCFALDFILEQDVQEVYGLPSPEIAAKKREMRLAIDQLGHYCLDKYPGTARPIQHYC